MNTRLLAAPLVLSIAMTGCMDSSMFGEPDSNAQKGAVTGAVIGGLLGASSGDKKASKAIVGAAIGGAIGGAIGQNLDRQAAALESELGNDQVKIVNTGSELIVTMPQDILFSVDSAVVVPTLQSDLRILAANLQDYPNTTVQVIGHTDNTGDASYNQNLSTRRAASVAAVLTGNGVASYRVQAIGRGEDAPVATNLSAEGRAMNRRVEIVITPSA